MAILISLLLASFSQSSDSAYVTFVRGKITNQATHKQIKIGDKISINDKVTYKSKEDMVVALLLRTGKQLYFSPEEVKQSNKGELTAILVESLLPRTSRHVSTRSGTNIQKLDDVKSYFSATDSLTEGRRLFINHSPLLLPPSLSPKHTENQYLLRYQYRNKLITYNLPNQGDSLLLAIPSLKSSPWKGQRPKPYPVEVLFISKSDTVHIASFLAIWTTEENLVKELKPMVKTLQKFSPDNYDNIKNEIVDYIYRFWGWLDERKVEDMVDQLLN